MAVSDFVDVSCGSIERFHRTLLGEHLRIAGGVNWYEKLDLMQANLDAFLIVYNTNRPHRVRNMAS